MSARKSKRSVARPRGAVTVEHTQSVARFHQHQGPLPSPETLFQYDQLHPGAAQKIIEMWEVQVRHRQDLEKMVVTSDLKNGMVGMWLGFVIAMTGVIGGTICILQGHEISGAVFGGASLTGLVSVFIYGSRERRKERESKANIVEQE